MISHDWRQYRIFPSKNMYGMMGYQICGQKLVANFEPEADFVWGTNLVCYVGRWTTALQTNRRFWSALAYFGHTKWWHTYIFRWIKTRRGCNPMKTNDSCLVIRLRAWTSACNVAEAAKTDFLSSVSSMGQPIYGAMLWRFAVLQSIWFSSSACVRRKHSFDLFSFTRASQSWQDDVHRSMALRDPSQADGGHTPNGQMLKLLYVSFGRC